MNKECAILIPGCGNSYEAAYLLQQGFTNITVIDIAAILVENLKNKFAHHSSIKIILGDFFEHQGNYDVIIEQTFFCALPPTIRQQYVSKMHELLNKNGKLIGLLFNRSFEKSPPFGGSKEEYEQLFTMAFTFLHFNTSLNSIAPRANTELWIELQKNEEVMVSMYTIEGITCSGCKNDITEKILKMSSVLNVSINSSFKELLLVSKANIEINEIELLIETPEKRYTLTEK